MFKKIFLFVSIVLLSITSYQDMYASEVDDVSSYTTLTRVDLWTYNEYRYRLTEQFFNLREIFNVQWILDKDTLERLRDIAEEWYNYLPDNLQNKNYLNKLDEEIKKWINSPWNDSYYISIVKALQNYIENVQIEKIKGKIEAFPKEWNAPMTVTLRWRVTDPTWTKIPESNYTWWINVGWKRKIIWNKPSINYTFTEEGTFWVFLDVKSNHVNEKWFTDVLSYRAREDIVVKEKVASVIIKVNSEKLWQKDELKFTPEEGRFWLLFDATSSTPTSWSKFIETSWNFWNGDEREYNSDPVVERVKYLKEWNFTVTLKLRTNELKTVERKFVIAITDPIASIQTNKEDWFLWEKFTFSTKTFSNDDELTYSWEIINTDKDEVVYKKIGSTFTYIFNEKWRYSVKLRTTTSDWEEDVDTKVIYINSRPPVADFIYRELAPNLPNTILLDASNSYDPDFTDDWNLKYDWIIDGNRVFLDNPNSKWSVGQYTFDSIWEHSIVLEVSDLDDIKSQKKDKVWVDSILSVDFEALPRVIIREWVVQFSSVSPEALFYEWDFWDGDIEGGEKEKISHKYTESWIYNVKLTVRDEYDNTNSVTKVVYVWESSRPYAFIDVTSSNKREVIYRRNECWVNWAYIVDKVSTVNFSWKNSVNITWKSTNLTYSWKLWNDKFATATDLSHRFDELGCFPVKLTVKSEDNNRTSSTSVWVKVENLLPTLSTIETQVENIDTDPVVVRVRALWAKDEDGVIQSYLWYYYTDVDSEPQDFRATLWPDTTFVLPKVTWNYYFVVVMKDNNEARVSSEEINDSKYFITLTGDNINTPLIKLSVDDSSVSVWEDVTFSTSVQNILWQDISKRVSYSWDFDGDWFYDKQTEDNKVSHSYKISWEFHAKVKVKHKWFSNTKSVTLNVVNKLEPDFEVISIWDKYVFLNTSVWVSDNATWDMWDGNTIEWNDSFVYTYEDGEKSHFVNLKLVEWTKIKEVNKKVVTDNKNLLKSKRPGTKIFTYPELNDQDQIVLENVLDKVFIYTWENTDYPFHWVDYDIEYDSDLNGWEDDDIDNKDTWSYSKWMPLELELNKKRSQKIRIIFKNEKDEVVDSVDIEIVKNYIEETDIDMSTITFDWIRDSDKLKIERLKNIFSNMPKEHRLKTMMYLQKLQEEWFDNMEKTRVIIEFETFIDSTWISEADSVIDILESFLVEDIRETDERVIAFNALKNLVPEDIECDYEKELYNNCKESVVSNLETIKNSSDLEVNKALWTSILNIIAKNATDKWSSWMSVKNAEDFKVILKSLVYWWINNIPEDEVDEVVSEDTPVSSDDEWWIIWKILYFLFIIIIVIFWIVWIYFIYYKLAGSKWSWSFEDFIIDKTKDDEESDVLWDISSSDEPKTTSASLEDKKEQKSEDVLSDTSKDKSPSLDKTPNNPFSENKDVTQSKDEAVPDWLKSNFDTKTDAKTTPELKSENIKETKIETQKPKEEKVEQKKDEISNDKKELDNITKIDEDKVPDWLKNSFDNTPKKDESKKEDFDNSKGLDNKKEEIVQQKEPVKKDENKSEENIPDWLRWSFEDNPKKEKKEEKIENKKQDNSGNKDNQTEKKEEKKDSPVKKDDKKEESSWDSDSNNKKDSKSKDDTVWDTLWDDWMKVPDWLKVDDDNKK